MHLSTIRQEVVERKRKEDSRSSFSLRQRWKANMSEWGRVAKARAGEAKGLGPKGWRKKMSVRKDKSSTFASCGWTVIIWGRPGMSFDCRIRSQESSKYVETNELFIKTKYRENLMTLMSSYLFLLGYDTRSGLIDGSGVEPHHVLALCLIRIN